MSEYHKPKTTGTRDFGSEGDIPEYCNDCDRDLRFFSRDWCRICIPEEARSKLFQVRLPLHTLNLIKAKHGNVSAYLRGLIANDLGPDALPEAALKRPGSRRLQVNTDL